MPPDNSTLAEVSLWLEYAEADLALAQVPLPEKSKYEMLLFHAQQAVEKALKAILIIHGIEVPHSHNLLKLVELLPPQYASIPMLAQATALTDYAVFARYPGEHAPVDEKFYHEMVKLAEDVVAWAQMIII